MDVIEISALATVGKPVPLGNLGTITLGPTNDRGETVVKFTMSRRLVKRIYRRQRPRFDIRRETDHNDGD